MPVIIADSVEANLGYPDKVGIFTLRQRNTDALIKNDSLKRNTVQMAHACFSLPGA
jgi:hypothetical protein